MSLEPPILDAQRTIYATPPNPSETYDLVIVLKVDDGHLANPSEARFTLTIEHNPDLPVGANETAMVTEAGGHNNEFQPEDTQAQTSGNVLDNDAASAQGGQLSVLRAQAEYVSSNYWDLNNYLELGSSAQNNPTELQGTYGMLYLGADGTYRYELNQSLETTQSLQPAVNGQNAVDGFDVFTYDLMDETGNTQRAYLTVTIQGSNDAPIALNPSEWDFTSPTYQLGQAFEWSIPANLFQDPDQQTLALTAVLNNGDSLSDIGLHLVPSTDSSPWKLSGTPSNATGDIDIRLTATDPFGAFVTTVFTVMPA